MSSNALTEAVSTHKPLERDIRVLVVDDADDLRKACIQGLELMGYATGQARSGAEAIELVRNESYDAVLLDLNMPGMDGLVCLRALKELRKDLEVLIVTGFGTISSAVEAMRLGASDYVAKPFSFDELDQRLQRCVQARDLRWENLHLRELLREKYHYENLVGKSEAMRRVFRMIRQAAQSRATVLLQGKSGTGKELAARAIHFGSPFAAGPMVTVDCGAIAPTVIESELFGHVKGAFTGAIQAKEGLFRQARGGTLFFDEIGELPLEMQTKLLRSIQEREIRPVGSDRTYPVDVRIVAATHRDLLAATKEGRFREDLYYRLNVICISIPALNERKDDIPLLLAHFLKKHVRNGRAIERISGQTMHALTTYDWPGNVRELENVVERAIAMGQGNVLQLSDLPPNLAALHDGSASGAAVDQPVGKLISATDSDVELAGVQTEQQAAANNAPLAPPQTQVSAPITAALSGQTKLDDIERQAILATLQCTSGDRTACARILGIDKSTLYRKLKKYNMAEGDGESEKTEL
jgi:two-component system response regulator HydG